MLSIACKTIIWVETESKLLVTNAVHIKPAELYARKWRERESITLIFLFRIKTHNDKDTNSQWASTKKTIQTKTARKQTKIERERSATGETVGMQRGYAQIKSLVWELQAPAHRLLTKVFVEYRTIHHASSGETQFKPQMAQSSTGATSTGENGGMRWNHSIFCNELINKVSPASDEWTKGTSPDSCWTKSWAL